MTGEQRDILSPLPQRGYVQRENVDSVIEVSPEPLCRDVFFEAPVGGGDKSEIRGESFFPSPDPLKFLALQDTEQPRLDVRGEITYFIQEERTLVGHFEPSDPSVGGARKGAFFMAEEFAGDEAFGEGTALHAHERAAISQALLMNRACYQVFPDPCLAQYQDGGVCPRDAGYLGMDTLHRRAYPDDAVRRNRLLVFLLNGDGCRPILLGEPLDFLA